MTTALTVKPLSDSKIERLLAKHVKDGFLIEDEGTLLLGALSARASKKLDDSCRSITEAFGDLNDIRIHSLHTFGGFKSFERFLQEWLDNHKESRSKAWYCMRAVTLWTQGLNRPLDELTAIKGGVYAIQPLLDDKDNKIVTEMNPQTGEVTSLSSGWEKILDEQYPDAETPTQKVAMWVADNLQPDDTGRSVKSALRDQREEAGTQKDRVKYGPVVQANDRTGKMDVVGFTWKFYPADGKMREGTGLKSMNTKLNRPILYHTLHLLGINLDTE